MKPLNKMSRDELRNKYLKIVKVQEKTSKFDYLLDDIEQELNERNRASIYKLACKVLNNNGENQFAMAAHYADAVINGEGYFPTDDSHEISRFDTKWFLGAVVVFFD